MQTFFLTLNIQLKHLFFREMGMMGSPNCLMETMCAADLKYPNESYSPKHGAMFADPRGKRYSLLIAQSHK